MQAGQRPRVRVPVAQAQSAAQSDVEATLSRIQSHKVGAQGGPEATPDTYVQCCVLSPKLR